MLHTIRSATAMAILVTAFISNANAQITINSVQRSVGSDATNFCMFDPQSAASTTVGSFNQSVSSTVFDMPPTCQGIGDATASQNTNVSATSFAGTGNATAFGDFGGDGNGHSIMMVDITVVAPTSYMLQATVDGKLEEFFPVPQTSPASGTVRLFNNSTTIFDATAPTIAGGSFSFAGIIPAGDYTFLASAGASASSTSQADASFNFVFTVPEPTGFLPAMVGGLFVLLAFGRRLGGITSRAG